MSASDSPPGFRFYPEADTDIYGFTVSRQLNDSAAINAALLMLQGHFGAAITPFEPEEVGQLTIVDSSEAGSALLEVGVHHVGARGVTRIMTGLQNGLSPAVRGSLTTEVNSFEVVPHTYEPDLDVIQFNLSEDQRFIEHREAVTLALDGLTRTTHSWPRYNPQLAVGYLRNPALSDDIREIHTTDRLQLHLCGIRFQRPYRMQRSRRKD